MNDRELLEYAAKAIGYVIDDHEPNSSYGTWVHESGDELDKYGEYPQFKWNPRNNNGDSLRLAVKLGIWVEPSHDQMTLTAFSIHNQRTFTARSGVDIYDATRQVILRAAGVIGKLMESKS